MSYTNISDCHNHSNISYDGADSPRRMCRQAQELGLLYYTMTDHCECEDYDKAQLGYRPVVRAAYDEMLKLQEEFPTLLRGIELGQPLQNPQAVKDVFAGRTYDFVIGSLHSLQNCRDFFFWKELNMAVYEALDRYFAELYAMVRAGGFDTLAHLTYPLRYIVGEAGIAVDMSRYTDHIRDLLRLLAEKGIALELNTSGLRQKIGVTLPDISYMKLYKSLGGELVTIGSDAHCAADLGRGLQEGLSLLEEAGFTHYAVFQNRQPRMVAIK